MPKRRPHEHLGVRRDFAQELGAGVSTWVVLDLFHLVAGFTLNCDVAGQDLLQAQTLDHGKGCSAGLAVDKGDEIALHLVVELALHRRELDIDFLIHKRRQVETIFLFNPHRLGRDLGRYFLLRPRLEPPVREVLGLWHAGVFVPKILTAKNKKISPECLAAIQNQKLREKVHRVFEDRGSCHEQPVHGVISQLHGALGAFCSHLLTPMAFVEDEHFDFPLLEKIEKFSHQQGFVVGDKDAGA